MGRVQIIYTFNSLQEEMNTLTKAQEKRLDELFIKVALHPMDGQWTVDTLKQYLADELAKKKCKYCKTDKATVCTDCYLSRE